MLDIACSKLAMPKPLTRAQALQNAAFLRILARTGNGRAAAREVGVAHTTLMHRRKVHAAFAQRWDAAVTAAQARLHAKGGVKGPAIPLSEQAPGGSKAHRTVGGEPAVVRVRDGRIQVRAAHPNRLTPAAEQAFLAALSATANVRLSARAAGAAEAAFYRRKRMNPAFAREWTRALAEGYRRIEQALIAGWMPDAYEDDDWRANDPPEMPVMTPNQALQLMYLHQKEVMGQAEPPHLKRRRGEPREAYLLRLRVMAEARREREREKFRVAEAARAAGTWKPAEEGPLYVLPDLSQVAGWSRAKAKAGAGAAHDPDRALFGGWRLAEMERRRGGR